MISALRQKSNFELFWKKIQIFWFPLCSTRENLSNDISITNVGLILTKLRGFIFSGCGQTDGQTDGRIDGRTDRQTDTVLESSYGNMSTHKKFQLKAQNKWLAVDPYMPPRRSGMHKNDHFIFAETTPLKDNNTFFFLNLHSLSRKSAYKTDFTCLGERFQSPFHYFHNYYNFSPLATE